MPESKSRKKPKPQRPPSVPKPETGNPRWLVPTMLGLMLVGLAWIVLFYLSGPKQLPVPPLGAVEPRGRLRLHHRGLRAHDALEVAARRAGPGSRPGASGLTPV